ncbi:MAG: DMT family transporter [Geminicoccaceae bacterium]
MTPLAQNLRGAGIMVLTIGLFACSDSILKLLFGRLPIGEVAFLRGVLVCLLIGGFLAWRHSLPPLHTCLQRLNLWRAAVEVTVAFTFFAALRGLPLANATTLIFASPIIMTVLGAVVLRERVGWHRWLAVLGGFAGVLVVAQPSGEGWNAAALLALLSAALVAVRDLLTRVIPGHLGAGSIALTSAVFVMVASAFTLPFGWIVPTAFELGLIGLAGILMSVAYATVVMAFRMGEISFIAPFRYTAIPLSVLLGYLVFGDVPPWTTYLGGAIIAVSGIAILTVERFGPARRAAAS